MILRVKGRVIEGGKWAGAEADLPCSHRPGRAYCLVRDPLSFRCSSHHTKSRNCPVQSSLPPRRSSSCSKSR